MSNESIADVERRIAGDRAELDATLREIETRLSPNGLADRAMDYMRTHGSDIAGHLGRAVKDNPFPLMLTGIGLAWLIGSTASGRHGTHARHTDSPYAGADFDSADLDDAAGDYAAVEGYGYGYMAESDGDRRASDDGESTMDEMRHSIALRRRIAAERAREAAHRVERQADETMEAFQERVTEAKAAVMDMERRAEESAAEFMRRVDAAVSEALERGRRSMRQISRSASQAMDDARHTARNAGKRAVSLYHDQPLLAVAAGVAVGALLGALMPATKLEEDTLGPYGEQARERVKGMARDVKDRAAHVAADTARAASEAADASFRHEIGADDGDRQSPAERGDAHDRQIDGRA
jgi:ElaB/YqjD/DUF883 family membrane-anchored ribosome-binding protein